MNIDSIRDGIVIDHITAGRAMEIYHTLGLDKLTCPVALIMNVHSHRCGQKDIIKVDGVYDIDPEVIGYISPGATVNFIREGKVTDKRQIAPPVRLTNIIRCQNSRCISTSERDIDHVFLLSNAQRGEYRCMYCETVARKK